MTKTAMREAIEKKVSPKGRRMQLKLIKATHELVAAGGVGAVTFRAVAQNAKVSPGSLSYHFKDKNDLLRAATEFARERFNQRAESALGKVNDGRSLEACLADLMEQITVHHRAEIEVDYDLYLASFNEPELRPMAVIWSHEMGRIIARYTTPKRAELLLYILEGMILHAAKFGRTFFEDQAMQLFSLVGKEE